MQIDPNSHLLPRRFHRDTGHGIYYITENTLLIKQSSLKKTPMLKESEGKDLIAAVVSLGPWGNLDV